MTAAKSNPTPRVSDKERTQLDSILAEPKFVEAYRRYTKTNSEFHVPYLAGSSNDGRTVYFDQRTPASTKPFIAEHEKVEGILIRKYGWDYEKAHKFATEAERTKVEGTLGINWKIYQEKLADPIRKAEAAPIKNLPPDLLEAAYSGTKYMNALKGNMVDYDKATGRRGGSGNDRDRMERDDL